MASLDGPSFLDDHYCVGRVPKAVCQYDNNNINNNNRHIHDNYYYCTIMNFNNNYTSVYTKNIYSTIYFFVCVIETLPPIPQITTHIEKNTILEHDNNSRGKKSSFRAIWTSIQTRDCISYTSIDPFLKGKVSKPLRDPKGWERRAVQ